MQSTTTSIWALASSINEPLANVTTSSRRTSFRSSPVRNGSCGTRRAENGLARSAHGAYGTREVVRNGMRDIYTLAESRSNKVCTSLLSPSMGQCKGGVVWLDMCGLAGYSRWQVDRSGEDDRFVGCSCKLRKRHERTNGACDDRWN